MIGTETISFRSQTKISAQVEILNVDNYFIYLFVLKISEVYPPFLFKKKITTPSVRSLLLVLSLVLVLLFAKLNCKFDSEYLCGCPI